MRVAIMFGLFKLIIYLISVGAATSETKFNSSGVYFSPPPQLTYDSDKPKDENGKWRKLSNGETVPAGSSVKVNLQTGEKLIKVNNDDSSKSGKKILKVEGYVTWNDVKYGLKQIKHMTSINSKKSKVQSNRTDYRDMKVVLQELDKFEFDSSTTEAGILKKFLTNYTKGSLADKLEILEEIEFLVHKYSFGKALVKLGGLEIFKKDAQETKNFTHKAMIAMTLGSAIQGNPVVKGAVITRNFIPLFIDFLTSEVDILQLRSTFALSALLRNYKPAQEKFFALKGYSVFADILNGKYSSSSKLLQKIVTLMADLLYENDPSEYTADEIYELGLSVYRLEHQWTILRTVILEYNMCSSFCSLLSSDNNVIVENVIKILDKLKQVCTKELLKVFPQINYLAVTYSQRMELEDDLDDWDMNNTKTYVRLSTMIYFLQKFLRDEL